MNSAPDEQPEMSVPTSNPADAPGEGRASSPAQAERSSADSSDHGSAGFDVLAAAPDDPPWTGWDVLAIFLAGAVAFVVLLLLAIGMTSGGTFQAKANRFIGMPEWGLAVQALAELVLLGCMYLVVASRTGGAKFWESLHWNWPANVGLYLLVGLLLQAVLLVAERFLPFPANTPFDAVLKRPYSIMVVALFSVTLGPLMEELLFRGFLYPVLRKHFGVVAGIIGTALPFGLIHLAQYGYSWASGLLIFVVGIVLATVRERANSLAAGFLVHVAYNGVIVALLLAATDGFRHLEKLNQ